MMAWEGRKADDDDDDDEENCQKAVVSSFFPIAKLVSRLSVYLLTFLLTTLSISNNNLCATSRDDHSCSHLIHLRNMTAIVCVIVRRKRQRIKWKVSFVFATTTGSKTLCALFHLCLLNESIISTWAKWLLYWPCRHYCDISFCWHFISFSLGLSHNSKEEVEKYKEKWVANKVNKLWHDENPLIPLKLNNMISD
jgi:hypothetical protein